ncbi:MAG TPA: adenosine deaminase [Gemmatimonadaceae bacterium]|nr:adenosine deaminase [Gemmatimonadaceae bacterium]
MTVTGERLRRLPKAELHCHLDGSLRAETLLELSREYGTPLPVADATALERYMVADDVFSLDEYLRRFAITVGVMQHAAALERVAAELVEDAARDGVWYLEMRYAPSLFTAQGLTLEETVEAPLRGIARASASTGTRARLIVCALRHLPPAHSLEMARLAVAYRDRGVVGFDLAGGEHGHPAAAHAGAFTFAREHDLAVTVHAGEAAGADSVRQAVHLCGADRVGHATRLIEDASLTRYVADRRIALELCLTSNVQTRAVPSYEAHPLRAYAELGMNVSLNTDNRLMSGTTLTDEYLHAARHLDFDFDALAEIALNGFRSAFLPWTERLELLAAAEVEIGRLRAAPAEAAPAAAPERAPRQARWFSGP